MERYPDLKANQNVLALQEELVTTENRVGFARQLYNDLVARYNTRQQIFPANLVAGALGFRSAEFFQVDAVDRAASSGRSRRAVTGWPRRSGRPPPAHSEGRPRRPRAACSTSSAGTGATRGS